MGRARTAIAARTTIEALQKASLSAFSVDKTNTESYDDFYDAVDFCRANSEEYEGEDGSEAWYFWQVGDWAIVGDISMKLARDQEAIEALSEAVGETIVGAIDPSFQYVLFSAVSEGETRRLLVLEDDELVEEGFPVAAERGRHLDDFDEEELERIWTSYGLPTFEHDPIDGPFVCLSVKSGG